MVVLLVVGSYLAYTKEIPFADKGFEVEATFENAATLRATAPVRIAGVNVGEVTDVELVGDAAQVTFTVNDAGLPIHEDATIEIRPRLFLEGNFFLELTPGSPSAPELEDGGSIPITQTATAVQLDQVLSALEGDIRLNLRRLLEGYGTALTYEPTRRGGPQPGSRLQGETAAESLNDSFEYGAAAGRGAAIVNDALIGQERGDLSGLIAAQADVFKKLASREVGAPGPDHELQHHDRSPRHRAGQPAPVDRRAGADARGGTPALARPQRVAACRSASGPCARAQPAGAAGHARGGGSVAESGPRAASRLRAGRLRGDPARTRRPAWRRPPPPRTGCSTRSAC